MTENMETINDQAYGPRVEPAVVLKPKVIKKQYRNGMTLNQLSELYEVDESVLAPYVEGVELKERKSEMAILVRQVKELYEQEQLGVRAISEILGKCQATIRKIVKENAFQQEPKVEESKKKIKTRGNRHNHEELSKEIEELLNAGFLVGAVIHELGIGKGTFYALKKKYGANWKVPKKGRPPRL